MQKQEGSTRVMGQASLATDKPTREKIKAIAAAHGLPVSEYLKVVADKGMKDLQGVLPGGYQPSPMTQVITMLKAIAVNVNDWSTYEPGRRTFTEDMKALDAYIFHSLGLNSTAEDFEVLRQAMKEYRERHSQLELTPNGGLVNR